MFYGVELINAHLPLSTQESLLLSIVEQFKTECFERERGRKDNVQVKNVGASLSIPRHN